MKIHNCIPLLLECLQSWEKVPSRAEFDQRYAEPMSRYAGDFFEGFHSVLRSLDWAEYRSEALRLDPQREEKRLRGHISDLEALFGIPLEGEALLIGAFCAMDGYARFDCGKHRVFLGVDESHGRGRYLDVLMVHELTHVARESRSEVWKGFGLNPEMTQDEFTDSLPVIEHLAGEGFSCAISELLVPGEPLWVYSYQEKESLERALEHAAMIDDRIHREISAKDGDYGTLYDRSTYQPRMPVFTHYLWAWQWIRELIHKQPGHDLRKKASSLLARSSAEWLDDALSFRLARCAPSLQTAVSKENKSNG